VCISMYECTYLGIHICFQKHLNGISIMLPRLVWITGLKLSSCLNLSSSGTTGVLHCT
jgi:hypothetical protein